MLVLQTVAGRFFLVALVVLVAAANGYSALTERILHPTIWYFYTEDGSGTDIRQSGGRSLVGRDILPSASPGAASSVRDKFLELCDRRTFGHIVSANWRDVMLCNAAGVGEAEFKPRNEYFRTAVDQLYSRYYQEVAVRHVNATLVAIGLWIALAATYIVCRWVTAPRRA